MSFLRTAPGRNPDTLRVIPNRILLAQNNQSSAIGAVAFLQENRVLLQWLIFHKVCTDNLPAVPVVEAHAQSFINDLLRKL